MIGARLRVDLSRPGWFQWGDPSAYHSWPAWVASLEPGPDGHRAIRPGVRERTREATLEALGRVGPALRAAVARAQGQSSGLNTAGNSAQPSGREIYPTEARLTFIYVPGDRNGRPIRITSGGMTNYQSSW
jgi:hypothetical protein